MKKFLRKIKLISFMLPVFLVSYASYAEIPQYKALSRLPPMMKVPQIDGLIDKDEWKDANASFGALKHNNSNLEPREAVFYFGYDQKNIYFACRSELPPGDMKMLARAQKRDGKVYADDAVELLLMAPDKKYVYHLIANSLNTLYDVKYPLVNGGVTASAPEAWEPKVTVASSFSDGYWNIEIMIPYSEIGNSEYSDGSEWSVQMCRDWSQPGSQTCWNRANVFCEPKEMGRIIFDKNSPVIKLESIGKNFYAGDIDCSVNIYNPSSSAKNFRIRMDIDSAAAPAVTDEKKTIKAGAAETVHLRIDDKTSIPRDFSVIVEDPATKKQYYTRSFSWEPKPKVVWNEGNAKYMEFDFAYYPSYNIAKGRIDISSLKDKDSIKGAAFYVREKKSGEKIGKSENGELSAGKYYKAKVQLPSMKEGEYEIVAELKKDGSDETLKFVREFTVKHFPWENNKIGLEDVIVPPFKPLVTGDNGRTVNALMSSYSMKNCFWDKITAQGENILASPVRLVLNGGNIKLEEKSFKMLSSKASSVVAEASSIAENIEATARYEYDYDGMCKLTLTLTPKKDIQIENGFLEIPLKAEIAKLFHSVNNNMKNNPAGFVPEGDGVVWDSRMGKQNKDVYGNFRPYFWMGGIYKGFCWFAESDKDWSVNPEKAALELVRDGKSTTLKVNLFTKPFIFDKPRTFVMGFQATPVKPQMKDWRRITLFGKPKDTSDVYKFAGLLSIFHFGGKNAGDLWPAGHDYSMVRELAKDFRNNQDLRLENTKPFVEKYFSDEGTQKKQFMLEHLKRGRAYSVNSDFSFPYLNARGSHIDWPEYQVYMDEWWCSEYRANSADEYNNHAAKSYQDMFLYYAKKLLDNGFDGLYYDNVRDWHAFSDVTGPAYELDNGTIQPYYDMFEFREFMKRSAVMIYVYGKKLPDGRPLFCAHMTNTNIIPFMSFASMTLDWEAHYGSTDFQTRFSGGYVLSQSLGTQTGCIPSVLIKITGDEQERVSRTFVATLLAYDLPLIFSQGGFSTALLLKLNTIMLKFGYGLDNVEVYPSWKAQDFVKVNSKDAKLSLFKKDSSAMISVSDFGGKDSIVELDITALNLGKVKAVNIETNEIIPVEENRIKLNIPKYDYRVLLIEKN